MAADSPAATSHITTAISVAEEITLRSMASITITIAITGITIAGTLSYSVARSMMTTMIMDTVVVADGSTRGRFTPAALTGGAATSFVQTTNCLMLAAREFPSPQG